VLNAFLLVACAHGLDTKKSRNTKKHQDTPSWKNFLGLLLHVFGEGDKVNRMSFIVFFSFIYFYLLIYAVNVVISARVGDVCVCAHDVCVCPCTHKHTHTHTHTRQRDSRV
jgi:hypothetical protein